MSRIFQLELSNEGMIFRGPALDAQVDAFFLASQRTPGLNLALLSGSGEYSRIEHHYVQPLESTVAHEVGFRLVHPVITAALIARLGGVLGPTELIVFNDSLELLDRAPFQVKLPADQPQGDFLSLTRHLHRNPARRLAVFTNVFNEGPMLQAWQAHYAKYLDLVDLYVIDDGSTDGSLGLLSRDTKIISIPKGEFDGWGMANFCSAFQRFLLTKYEWVCHVDCDELLIAKDDFGSDAFLKRLHPGRIYKADEALLVVQEREGEAEFDFSLRSPITAQRKRFGQEIRGFLKPVLASIPVTWGPGYHYCLEPSEPLQDFWLLHLKYVDFKRLCYRYHQWSSMSSSSLTDAYYWHVKELRETDHRQVMDEVRKEIDKVWPEDRFVLPEWVVQAI